MGFQCMPQLMGLVRGEPQRKTNGKVKNKTANGRSILGEAGEERFSNSKTIDRSRSYQNVYTGRGDGSGVAVWDSICKEADEYRSEYTDKNGVKRSRKLQKRSVVAVMYIINPPQEILEQMTRDECERFMLDADAVMREIEPVLFDSDNFVFGAAHYDEMQDNEHGYHEHKCFISKDADGRFCGSRFDSQLLTRVCKEFPEKMRARGWDVEDCVSTDYARYGSDEAYRKETDERKMKQGMSQSDYIALKETEELIEKKQDKSHVLDLVIETQYNDMEQVAKYVEEYEAELRNLDESIARKQAEHDRLSDEILNRYSQLGTLRERVRKSEDAQAVFERTEAAIQAAEAQALDYMPTFKRHKQDIETAKSVAVHKLTERAESAVTDDLIGSFVSKTFTDVGIAYGKEKPEQEFSRYIAEFLHRNAQKIAQMYLRYRAKKQGYDTLDDLAQSRVDEVCSWFDQMAEVTGKSFEELKQIRKTRDAALQERENARQTIKHYAAIQYSGSQVTNEPEAAKRADAPDF